MAGKSTVSFLLAGVLAAIAVAALVAWLILGQRASEHRPPRAPPKAEILAQTPEAADPVDASVVATLSPTLTNTVFATGGKTPIVVLAIRFAANSWDPRKTVTPEVGAKNEPYDPHVDLVIEKVRALSDQNAIDRILIRGHTDASQRENIPAGLMTGLAARRAEAVEQELLAKISSLRAEQITTTSVGSGQSADPAHPNDRYRNRRVEILCFGPGSP